VPKSNTPNISLTGFDSIFKSTVPSNTHEEIVLMPLDELLPPDYHPFQVNDDDEMNRLVESVKKHGVREPGIVRIKDDGTHELLAGFRRKRASELAAIPYLPVIKRKMDDDDAVLTMVDSNLERREKLLFSEKAWAYRMKMEALNHKGKKSDLNSVDILVEQTGESRNQIFRLIRLTELICTLLDKVDARQIAFNPAVELSYLTQKEQSMVAEVMEKYEIKPSLSQAQRIKKLSQEGKLTLEKTDKILSEIKKAPLDKSTETDKYRQFFPPNYSSKQIDKIITTLLRNWQSEKCRTQKDGAA